MAHFAIVCDREDITPSHSVPLAGFGAGVGFSDVHDKLEINAAIIYQGQSKVALISIDALFVGWELRRIAERELSEFPPEAILFGASHTHFAPATDRVLPLLGKVDEDHFASVCEKLVCLLRRLQNAERIDVALKYTNAEAHHSINRRMKRLWWPRKKPFPHLKFNYYSLNPNESGLKNETVHTVGFFPIDNDEISSTPILVLWSYTCHPVSQPFPNCVSADYPGVVRETLRNTFGKDLACLFFQGFTGDIRPRIIARSRSYKSRLKKILLHGDQFGSFTPETWDDWAGSLANVVTSTVLENGVSTERYVNISGTMLATGTYLPLSELQDKDCDRPDMHFQQIVFGQDIAIVAVSAEAVQGVVALLPDSAQIQIPIGYTDHTFGYLPTNEIVKEGGYEAHEFREAFSLPGRYIPDVDTVLRAQFNKLSG